MEARELWSTLGLAVAAAVLCLGLTLGLAFAQQQGTTAQGIPYLGGGIGDEERQAMDAMAGQYNLKLEFAARTGPCSAASR